MAGQVAGFAGKQQEVDNYNAAAKQNAINANIAATNKYTDEGRRLQYESKEVNQEGYEAVMKARQAKGTAVASGVSSGIDVSSLSLNSIMSSIENDESRSADAVQTRHDANEDTFRARGRTYEAEAQGRINSMPFKEGPSPLGLVLGIATEGFNAFAKRSKMGAN